MYITLKPNNIPHQVQLRGFSEPSLSADHDRSVDAIRRALQLNPFGGYVKGSPARRALEEAFESVPSCSALKLGQQLMKSEGALEKSFRHRLHADTQKAMIQVLIRKAKECQEQEKAELRRMEEEERRRVGEFARTRQLICASLAKSDQLVEVLCKKSGESSDQCRTFRAKARKEREQ